MMLVERLPVLLLELFVLFLADYGTGSENMGEIISSLEDISEILFNKGYNSWGNTIRKTIALLKQEAVEPTLKREGRNKYYSYYVCPRCDDEVVYDQNYCSECGVRFLWEGR